MSDFGESISPHTLKKWELLRRYLEKYTLIMSNKYWKRFMYIDGFAGKGRYDEYDGSPVIAMSTTYPFTDYIFIEKEIKSFGELKKNVQKILPKTTKICRELPPNSEQELEIKVTFENKDVNEFLQNNISSIIPKKTPCFIFLDPEGMGLSMDTLSVCSKNKIELLINFPINGVIRNMEIPGNEDLITKLYGSEDWKKFGVGVVNREEKLAELYVEGLRSFFKYIKNVPIKNEKNTPVYDLIFATNNLVGFTIMNAVMSFGQRKLNKFIKSA